MVDQNDERNVPVEAELARRVYTFHVESVPTGQSGVDFDQVVPGFQGVVENIDGHAESSAANADVDVQIAGTTILSSVVAEPSGRVDPTLVSDKDTRTFSETEKIALNVTTDGTGTITGLTLQVTVRPRPMGGEVGA